MKNNISDASDPKLVEDKVEKILAYVGTAELEEKDKISSDHIGLVLGIVS